MTFVLLQGTIGACSAIVALLSLRSYKRTGDEALKNISWAFLYFVLHSFALIIAVSFYTSGLISERLKLELIFAKVPLFIGLLYLLHIPIIFQNTLIKNYYNKILVFSFFLILITSLASYFSPEQQIVSWESKFVVEYIGFSLNAAGILLLPYFVVALFVYSLWSNLPSTAGLFFKSKIVLLCLGMCIMLIGYSTYILSISEVQSLLGVSLVFIGDLLIVGATALSPVRRFILTKNLVLSE